MSEDKDQARIRLQIGHATPCLKFLENGTAQQRSTAQPLNVLAH